MRLRQLVMRVLVLLGVWCGAAGGAVSSTAPASQPSGFSYENTATTPPTILRWTWVGPGRTGCVLILGPGGGTARAIGVILGRIQ